MARLRIRSALTPAMVCSGCRVPTVPAGPNLVSLAGLKDKGERMSEDEPNLEHACVYFMEYVVEESGFSMPAVEKALE